MDEAGLADTAVVTAQATVPEEPQVQAAAPTKKAKKQAKPEAREPLEPDPMFFPMLLRTQRLLERDARSAKISSLRIM